MPSGPVVQPLEQGERAGTVAARREPISEVRDDLGLGWRAMTVVRERYPRVGRVGRGGDHQPAGHRDLAMAACIRRCLDNVRAIFLAAWRTRVKGITVYRDGGKSGQVLTLLDAGDAALESPIHVDTAFTGRCAGYLCEF